MKHILRGLCWVVIFGTHIYLIATGAAMSANQVFWHSILNLSAGAVLFLTG